MQIDVFTLFPEIFPAYLNASILKKAIDADILQVSLHNIRDWTTDKHKVTDDTPYGGGGGMILKPEPIFTAIESVLGDSPDCPVIFFTPQGRVLNQQIVEEISRYPRIGILCGHYEGVDERVRAHLVTDEISIGDYVLTGGELPALILIDAVSRQFPGVLGDPMGAANDSHADGLLEHPHYTRPEEYRGWQVPDVLKSGDHSHVAQWRRRESLRRTSLRRPDLIQKAELTPEERRLVEVFLAEGSKERSAEYRIFVWNEIKRFLVEQGVDLDIGKFTRANKDLADLDQVYYLLVSRLKQKHKKETGILNDGFLQQALINFDVKGVAVEKKINPQFLLINILSVIDTRKVSTGIENFCRAVLGAADYLSKFDDLPNFLNFIDSFTEDEKTRKKLLDNLSKNICGFDHRTAANFLKDLGYVQFSTPDKKLVNLFEKIGLSSTQKDDVNDIIQKFAEDVGEQVWEIEHIFLLLGSGDNTSNGLQFEGEVSNFLSRLRNS
ncbi:MAG: tRNA (guanosine(37)-N1)-methyltransferase TrmD [Anaerolineales bacterium]|nr:tRNA (guanosine(37)-N1)-methyltransferase TrmD [Anaerolineales bacterium]